MKTLPSRREMDRAFYEGDAGYDGIFWVGVTTTRIFCRPSCPARKPRPENVLFFESPRRAMEAGYRPCLRCKPAQGTGAGPAWIEKLVGRVLETPEQRFTDDTLREMNIDPVQARRWFQSRYGKTFAVFCREWRLGQAAERLRQGADLDEVILSHGYESHSGFREAFRKQFSRPPGQAKGMELLLTKVIEGPLGPMLAGATEKGICLLAFGDPSDLAAEFQPWLTAWKLHPAPGTNPRLDLLSTELERYFAGQSRTFSVPLDLRGTEFQRSVWNALCEIPYGTTCSYEALARAIGRPGAQRAVGLANGGNPVAIVVPCHRVVNKNGAIGGYGGGLWRKRWLLDLEQNNGIIHGNEARLPGL